MKGGEWMIQFLETVGNFLKYKEPKNEELGFELLEDGNEGVDHNTIPNTANNENVKEIDEKQQKNLNNSENKCNPPNNPEDVSANL